ncbi:MAG: energy coupling factor transporter S component ThiW [Chloroflexi bacterium]|nr:energy coupling factor transporter S component ThiW [Chloroflexota bacterium]
MSAVATNRTYRPASQAVGLSIGLGALGIDLALFVPPIPIGPIRAQPFQALINVLAGVLIGPWYGILVALVISIVRNALGVGSFFAFPGSVFGVFLVGVFYHYVRKTDHAAWLEIVGTVFVGGTVAYYLALATGPMVIAGFMKIAPFASFGIPGVVSVAGVLGLWLSFAIGSVPGAILGFLVLKALRLAGMS